MWDDVKESRWNELRQRELEGKLTAAEQEELNRFYGELDNEEHIALQPALAQLDAQIVSLQREYEQRQRDVKILARLAEQEETTLRVTEARVAQLRAEYATLKKQYARQTGEELAVPSNSQAAKGTS
jgi:chromosome segregation ATPase